MWRVKWFCFVGIESVDRSIDSLDRFIRTLKQQQQNQELLHAWRLWDSVLAHADRMEPAIYPLGFDIDEIDVIGQVGVGAGTGGECGFAGEL